MTHQMPLSQLPIISIQQLPNMLSFQSAEQQIQCGLYKTRPLLRLRIAWLPRVFSKEGAIRAVGAHAPPLADFVIDHVHATVPIN